MALLRAQRFCTGGFTGATDPPQRDVHAAKQALLLGWLCRSCGAHRYQVALTGLSLFHVMLNGFPVTNILPLIEWSPGRHRQSHPLSSRSRFLPRTPMTNSSATRFQPSSKALSSLSLFSPGVPTILRPDQSASIMQTRMRSLKPDQLLSRLSIISKRSLLSGSRSMRYEDYFSLVTCMPGHHITNKAS